MSASDYLPGTEPLDLSGDLAMDMVAGIDRFLTRELQASVAGRGAYWQRDFTSHRRYMASVQPNRQRLREMIGLVDAREAAEIQQVIPVSAACAEIGKGAGHQIYEVRWPVLKGVDAEGLLLQPDGDPVATVIALPDCDATPEMLAGLAPGVPESAQFARRLAENGCRVLVPALIDRRDTYSGVPGIRMTNQPHREFIYRAAFELGRHIIGYEVQKTLAAVDAFSQAPQPVGVFGYGEGGLIAFYAAAVDVRIHAAAVSGYFQPREDLWREPIYRNLFGLLQAFGDAEIASLIAPRPLIVEASQHPEVDGPPPPSDGRGGAAPGRLTTPPVEAVEVEIARAMKLTEDLQPVVPIRLVKSGDGSGPPGCSAALNAFLEALGPYVGSELYLDPTAVMDRLRSGHAGVGPAVRMRRRLKRSAGPPERLRGGVDPDARHKRQFEQLLDHTQHGLREAEFRRADYWSEADASDLETWAKTCRPYRDRLWNDVIGPLPPASLPANPRTRLLYETPRVTAYEVALDVYADVFAYGILLVPTGIPEGERRPVVVCQHGLEGRPQPLVDAEADHHAYHQYAYRLARLGFVTYAPQNPYLGGDAFRVLQRKANPLKMSLFSFIVRQHERTLEWLSERPFVDPDRIAFYGISYGGKTAMRVPALLDGYCLSICSADFNEWIWKNASARHRYSYLLTGEYEMFEFNLGNTFNYAEMSWLICPRPFMVERGHDDGVAPDEWVAYEYARTRRRYVKLGVADRTEIEFFDGPHSIHGVGAFDFLRRHLKFDLQQDGKGGRY